jgi:hypothetical protein
MRVLKFLVVFIGLGAGCFGGSNGGMLYVPMPDADLTAIDTNPEGAVYPTENIGGQPRTATQAGQIFPNLTLAGVRSITTKETPAVVSMAEFYDPEGLNYDLLHVTAIFFWCPHCDNETKALASIAAWQAEHRVAVVQIAMQGYGSAAPGWSEVQKWTSGHNLNFPVLVDSQGAELSKYFNVDYVPINIMVNPRTMEVLTVQVGEVGDMQAYEQKFLDSL